MLSRMSRGLYKNEMRKIMGKNIDGKNKRFNRRYCCCYYRRYRMDHRLWLAAGGKHGRGLRRTSAATLMMTRPTATAAAHTPLIGHTGKAQIPLLFSGPTLAIRVSQCSYKYHSLAVSMKTLCHPNGFSLAVSMRSKLLFNAFWNVDHWHYSNHHVNCSLT